MISRLLRVAGLAKTASISSEKRAQANAARVAGDQARDEGEWSQAADQYREFLAVYPNHAGIWVQLGNVLKEALEYRAAACAYARARLLSPRDADIHLQLGHLRKRQGRMAKAAAHYRRALKLDAMSFAAVELRNPEIANHLRGDDAVFATKVGSKTIKKLQSHIRGLTISAASGISIQSAKDGLLLSLSSDDPWMEFTIDSVADAKFGLLEFDIEWPSDRGGAAMNRFYVNYGSGYSEELTLNLARDDKWIRSLLIAAPSAIHSIRWDPDAKPNMMRLRDLRFRALPSMDEVNAWMAANPYDVLDGEVETPDLRAFAQSEKISAESATAMQYRLPTSFDKGFNYKYWWDRYIKPSEQDYARMKAMEASFAVKPKFSFVMPVYNPPVEFLEECIDSMLAQNYADFEICIADDCSPDPEIAELLQRYEQEHGDKVKVAYRPRNGHISAASNSALDLVTGDYVVLVDHDDLVPDFALWVIAYYINRHPDAKILFSDEDKISPEGRRFTPYFKSEYNEYLMYGHNMVSHIGVYATDLLRQIGGFRLGYEGSQDYDLFLRAYERIGREQVVHIPHVLYHWRAIPGSTAVSADQKGYAIYAAQAAINGYFERNGIPLRSVDGFAPGCTGIRATRANEDSLSIIIPTKDGLDILKPCIESIVATKPINCQIIVVDNGSEKRETIAYLEKIAKDDGVLVLSYPKPFNFSAINNFAAQHATGDILCFLNNDTEILSRNWLDRARSLLALPGIGMVGARLLFPDRHVQHFGIALGVGGHRIAGTPHAGYHRDQPGYFGKSRLIQEFSAVTAACMFIRKRDFDAVGGFDPDFRVAYNDVDLCLKVRERGLRILCDPEIELIHKESRTRGSDKEGERALRLEQEAELMHARWGEQLQNDPYYSPNLSPERVDFALAYPPRVPMPWQVQSGSNA